MYNIEQFQERFKSIPPYQRMGIVADFLRTDDIRLSDDVEITPEVVGIVPVEKGLGFNYKLIYSDDNK